MGNLLNLIPKPLLKRADRMIHSALEEEEKKSNNVNHDKTLIPPKAITRIVEQESLSMAEIINWAKNHYPENEDVNFIVVKEPSDKMKYDFLLYFVYTKEGKPLLDNQHHSLAVYAQKLDSDLEETFNNNDIIEFE